MSKKLSPELWDLIRIGGAPDILVECWSFWWSEGKSVQARARRIGQNGSNATSQAEIPPLARYSVSRSRE